MHGSFPTSPSPKKKAAGGAPGLVVAMHCRHARGAAQRVRAAPLRHGWNARLPVASAVPASAGCTHSPRWCMVTPSRNPHSLHAGAHQPAWLRKQRACGRPQAAAPAAPRPRRAGRGGRPLAAGQPVQVHTVQCIACVAVVLPGGHAADAIACSIFLSYQAAESC